MKLYEVRYNLRRLASDHHTGYVWSRALDINGAHRLAEQENWNQPKLRFWVVEST